MNANLDIKAKTLIDTLTTKKLMLITAESCTGGLIAATLTNISGASNVLYGGFVTYANTAKENMLGVTPKTLNQFGAVSAETAKAMAKGALHHSNADISIAVTGVAGPLGGTAEKPVGLVHIACAMRNGDKINIHHQKLNLGDQSRNDIRQQTVAKSIDLILQVVVA